jgi:2-phosphosulfolactate phosphatase
MQNLKLRWGTNGMRRAIKEKNIVVIVDVFRFSSAVVTAISNKVTIIPASNLKEAVLLSKKYNAIISNSYSPTSKRIFSLSPQSFFRAPKNIKVALISPNGARCCRIGKNSKNVFIGCFLNAKTIGKYVEKLSENLQKDVTILAAGDFGLPKKFKRSEVEEQFITKSNSKFFSLEDFLGAGAIINEMKLEKNDDAIFAQNCYNSFKKELRKILRETVGGKYLILTNREKDLEYCIKLNRYKCIPKLSGEIITQHLHFES